MSTKTISFCQGKGSLSHNNRTFINKNVDVERIEENVTFIKQPIAEAYEQLFGQAVQNYNAKQKRDDRRIKTSYFEYAFNHAPSNNVITAPDKRKSFYEDLVQVGDKNDSGCGTPDGKLVAECLTEYMNGFSQRNPNLYVFNAVLHLDEATPHLHIDYIPVGHYKRGVELQNGLSQALKEMGYFGIDAINKWRIAERKVLEDICNSRGIEIREPEQSRGSFAVEEYKEYKDTINSLQTQVDNLNTQVEFESGHVEFLESRVEEISANIEKLNDGHWDMLHKNAALENTINDNNDVINQQAAHIQNGQSELAQIAKKKIDIAAIENIETKQIPLSKNIAVKKEDLENLLAVNQKYIALDKSQKKLKSRVAELEEENKSLVADNAKLKQSQEGTIKLKIENGNLQNKNITLEKTLAKIYEFLICGKTLKRFSIHRNSKGKNRIVGSGVKKSEIRRYFY